MTVAARALKPLHSCQNKDSILAGCWFTRAKMDGGLICAPRVKGLLLSW